MNLYKQRATSEFTCKSYEPLNTSPFDVRCGAPTLYSRVPAVLLKTGGPPEYIIAFVVTTPINLEVSLKHSAVSLAISSVLTVQLLGDAFALSFI